MPGLEAILSYTGNVDYHVIDRLLKKLKLTKEFKALDITTSKRFYGIMVESLENIARHSSKSSSSNHYPQPFIIAEKKNNRIIIRTGNCFPETHTVKLAERLNEVNAMNEKCLVRSYEMIINKDVPPNHTGTGLGFILIKLRSGNNIEYTIEKIDNSSSFFEMQISINRFIMRKLIIEKTASTPAVILDPEKKIYTISGESRPSDVREFYDQILLWLNEFSVHLLTTDNLDEPVVFNFNFEYFNSSSAKLILDICKVLGCLLQKGNKVTVKWHYEKGDTDMLEVGNEMSKIVRFPFEFVEI